MNVMRFNIVAFVQCKCSSELADGCNLFQQHAEIRSFFLFWLQLGDELTEANVNTSGHVRACGVDTNNFINEP